MKRLAKHQMVTDMLIANLKFLEGLSEEELKIFREAARISTETEMAEWDDQAAEAKRIAQEEMGVEFIDAYFAAIFIVLMLVIHIPAFSLWLPSLMGYV